MNVRQAHDFTHRRLFLADTILNWFLGVVLVIFPATVDGVLAKTTLAGPLAYRVIGVIFLAFAAWQTWVDVRPRMTTGDLYFAAFMALVPVVLLTVALLFMDLPLLTAWRVILWVGNVYMLLLGVWYIFVGRLISTQPDQGPESE